MDTTNFEKLYQQETTPEALEKASAYIAGKIKPFLSLLEPVLICFPDTGAASLGAVFRKAVEQCGAIAISWGPDYRWQELLRLAFDSHANTVVGPPEVLLGLMKLARATKTPLYIYDMIACGDPFPRWMVNDMKRGLDCQVWGCYAVHSSPVIAGFSCEQEAGIHIREDLMVPVLDCGGNPGYTNRGRLYFKSAGEPEFVFDPEQIAMVQQQPCSCGSEAPRVVETTSIKSESDPTEELVERILTWTSVLDFRAFNTESGLKLELVVFPNEKLPKLPSCAHLNIRNWDPERDIPFLVQVNYPNQCENSF